LSRKSEGHYNSLLPALFAMIGFACLEIRRSLETGKMRTGLGVLVAFSCLRDALRPLWERLQGGEQTSRRQKFIPWPFKRQKS